MFTFCPPGPLARVNCSLSSQSSITISSVTRSIPMTRTDAIPTQYRRDTDTRFPPHQTQKGPPQSGTALRVHQEMVRLEQASNRKGSHPRGYPNRRYLRLFQNLSPISLSTLDHLLSVVAVAHRLPQILCLSKPFTLPVPTFCPQPAETAPMRSSRYTA